ncbi:MAG: SUMF1/EgtB/PvdO family nonheme iron enzyme [Pseudomonadota bacterium]
MNVRGPRPVEVSGYRLVRWLGTRGTASLYVGVEPSRDRPAAIKIFHRVDAETLARIEGQLQENARLSHPNIVPVDAIGRTSDGRLFYAMPLLRDFEQARDGFSGRSLRIVALLRDLLAALDHAHQRGVVHGDIKASNVLFDEQGRALLADFGIARCMAETHGELADPQSDLYDIGMLARDLLGGASPTQRRDAVAPHASSRQPMPQLRPGAAAWQPWFDKALAEAPDRQFRNAQAMADALDAVTVSRHYGGGGPPTTPEPRRVPKWPLRTVLPIAAIIALLGWTGWDYLNESRAPDNAPATANPATPVMSAASVAMPVAPPASMETAAVPPVASVDNPALTIPVVEPATTLPAPSSLTMGDRVQALVTSADALRAQDRLFSPPFHNAASQYLAALDLDPGNASAIAGIDAMLRTLRRRLDKTWDDGRNTSEAADMLRQGDELAKHADASGRHTWHNYRRRLARHVGATLARAARAQDKLVLAALQPLAKALHVAAPDLPDPAPNAPAASAPVAGGPAAGARLRDPQGPLLVYVPADGGRPAFAIERVEVTRADYAAFVRATQRPAASCLAAHNPFSRLRHLTWRAPGFTQGGDHPVVCVSWDDAAAYAAWLSRTAGEPYRLPSADQWLRAAQGMPKASPCKLGNVDDASRHNRLDDDRWSCSDGAPYTAPVGRYAASGVGAYDLYGNVSEWMAGGNAGSRPFRGVSWRDGSHETPLGNRGTADADVGYSSVGFRVVRVIDAAHPAPPAASGH